MELGNISAASNSTLIKFCLAKAAECRRGAELATDPSRKQSWLQLEGRWFFLARSYDNGRRAVIVRASVKSRSTEVGQKWR
jgi:hypothetical protein